MKIFERIFRKFYRILKHILLYIKRLITNDIFVYCNYIFYKKMFVGELSKIGIKNAEPFMVNSWHFGYEYYVGKFDGKNVFIKYNSHGPLINHEYKNLMHLRANSAYLSHHVPNVYSNNSFRSGRYIVEDYIEGLSVRDTNFIHRDTDKIINQLLEICRELQRIKFQHLDINTANVFIGNNDEVYLIDFGFSNINENTLNIFKNDHFRNLIISNLNKDTRLDIAVIDDAYSFLVVAKAIDPNIISSSPMLWKSFIALSDISIFDGRCYI